MTEKSLDLGEWIKKIEETFSIRVQKIDASHQIVWMMIEKCRWETLKDKLKEDLKSAVQGLLQEIEKMPTYQIVPRFGGINFIPKSDVKNLVKKWFSDEVKNE